jgi:hypothetical protein
MKTDRRSNQNRIDVRVINDILRIGADLPHTQPSGKSLSRRQCRVSDGFQPRPRDPKSDRFSVEGADPSSPDKTDSNRSVVDDRLHYIAHKKSPVIHISRTI